jgi:hypothetical protein
LLLETLREVERREAPVAVLQTVGAGGPACDDESCAV